MSSPKRLRQRRGLTVMNGAGALIAAVLVVQMWLLTATLESYLAGHDGAVLPAAILSTLGFLVSFALYRFTVRVDRQLSGPSRPRSEDRG